MRVDTSFDVVDLGLIFLFLIRFLIYDICNLIASCYLYDSYHYYKKQSKVFGC